ncbi:MAG: response regulator transcription factor [Alphaproteobacteria bacterium]|nr:response regulator transcription factor [Alphaproteobacteria bacterium]
MKTDCAHILVIDDDLRLRHLLQRYLQENGFAVSAAKDAETARLFLTQYQFDLLIIDVMMPNESGIEFLQKLRQESMVPAILLTAMGETQDRIAGLEAGADDYLPKPFDVNELLARIRAMLRRRENYVPDVITFEDLSLDKGKNELYCGKKVIQLMGKNYQIMELLMENPRIIFSVQQLMERIWGWDAEAEINVVWVNISQLRKKLAELNSQTEIRMHRGTGYSLEKKSV